MEANIIFDNVKAYNVVKWDVKLGETFKVELINTPGSIRWFADNDPSLHINVGENGFEATIKATEKGICEIQLQYQNASVKNLLIEVYDNIAVSLNPVVGSAKLK